MKNLFSNIFLLKFIIIFVFQNTIFPQASYDSQFGSSGSGNGNFDNPNGIAVLSNGNILVADRNNERIQVFNSSGVYQSQFGSSGSGDGQFFANNGPVDIVVDGSDNIYVVDRGNSRVQIFNSSGVYQSQFGSNGTGNGEFDNPNGIAILSNGNILVADRNNERVQVFNSSGVYQSQFGSSGSGDGQFAANNGAVDIAVDGSDNIWVVDRGNHRVQKFNSSGVYQDQFGSNGTGNGEFNQPTGIGIASTSDIYVCDRLNERVQVFNSSGVYQSQFGGTAGSGNGEFASNNGCVDLEFDGSTGIYVVDRGNSRVQKFTDAALPVELTSFTALIKENSIELRWNTATEINNYGFSIERKSLIADSKPNVTPSRVDEWKAIGFVLGHGNSNSPKDYSFIDENVEDRRIFYRLKQIDYDGSYEYSNVIEISLSESLPSQIVLKQNYPNPFNPNTVISYQLSEVSIVKLTIYDALGKEIKSLVNERQIAGSYSYNFNAEKLASGTYIYKLSVDDFVETKKMVLIK